MPTIYRLTLRTLAGPTAVTLVLLCAAGLVLQVAGLLLGAAVAPDPATTVRISVDLLPAVLEYALPVAFLVGATLAYGRWQQEGTWVALRASGLGGRHLLAPALGMGLGLALIMASASHRLAPAGRRAANRALASAHEQVELLPGHFLELGGVVLHRPTEGGLMVAEGNTVLLARSGELEPREGGLVVRLSEGRAMGGQTEPALAFEEAVIPLSLGAQGRAIELAERSDKELATLVDRMERRGKDASYQHSVLLKRSTLPIGAALLPLLCLPLGLRWGGKPSHAMAVVVGYWALVRIGDASCQLLGPSVAASLPVLGLLATSAVLWLGWRDR